MKWGEMQKSHLNPDPEFCELKKIQKNKNKIPWVYKVVNVYDNFFTDKKY